mgnify:CR=1 FL=1
MAATLAPQPPGAAGVATGRQFPPIDFFYRHFHNSIRDELATLAGWAKGLDATAPEAEVNPKLQDLRSRYKFLEQVYKYHSNVEDEVRRWPRAGSRQKRQRWFDCSRRPVDPATL